MDFCNKSRSLIHCVKVDEAFSCVYFLDMSTFIQDKKAIF